MKTVPKTASPPVVQQTVPQQRGIMSEIAANASSIAIGHTMGRMLSGALGLGGAPVVNSESNGAVLEQSSGAGCDDHSKRFLDCMASHHDDVSACQSYLEMMKACQESQQRI